MSAVTSDMAMGADFTLPRYRYLLQQAKQRYRFEPFGTDCAEPHVLWRHDIDYSMECALRVAEIEAEEGVRATYFLLLSAPYYNLLDAPTADMARAIAAMGHHIGLHFDPTVHAGSPASLEENMQAEADILERVIRAPVRVMSFHNPAKAGVMDMAEPYIGGLLNVYGGAIRANYVYNSDSFGLWRFTPLHELLATTTEPRLHLLTHPIWWCKQGDGPRRKIARLMADDAARGQEIYDTLIRSAGMWDRVISEETR